MECLLPLGHLLLSDTYSPSSDGIDAISAPENLRLKNLGRIIIGYLNINSIRNKFEALNVIVSHNLDVLMGAETKIDDSFPKVNDITIGVLQGSCLGPLPFLMYINDLPLAITNSNTSMYADDTSICYHSHEITQLNEAIKDDLYKLEKWLEGNKLSLNVLKTRAMLISTKQKDKALQNQNHDLRVKIKGTELDTVMNTRYLGVNIESSLDWKEYIKVIPSKF